MKECTVATIWEKLVGGVGNGDRGIPDYTDLYDKIQTLK